LRKEGETIRLMKKSDAKWQRQTARTRLKDERTKYPVE